MLHFELGELPGSSRGRNRDRVGCSRFVALSSKQAGCLLADSHHATRRTDFSAAPSMALIGAGSQGLAQPSFSPACGSLPMPSRPRSTSHQWRLLVPVPVEQRRHSLSHSHAPTGAEVEATLSCRALVRVADPVACAAVEPRVQ